MGDEGDAIIIDAGSALTKIGYSGEEEPKSIFPTLVGTPQYQELIAAEVKEYYYGNDAYAKRGLLNFSYPIDRGTIENFDHFEKLMDYAYSNELRVDPVDYPVHITESLQATTKVREQLLKYFFETLDVPMFYISGQALLSVYATGATTGLAIEIGDGLTQIVPVSGGFTLKHASQKIDLAGRDITTYLNDIIYLGNHNINSFAAYEITREMKEKLCRVSMDFDTEIKEFSPMMVDGIKECKYDEYKLPDGSVFKMNGQCIMAPELMFDPKLDCRDIPGFHHFALECINRADIDLRPELCNTVNFSGGGSMLPNLVERFQAEMEKIVPEDCIVNTVASEERENLCWIGGSVLTSLESFEMMWIQKSEYEEHGMSILKKKVLF